MLFSQCSLQSLFITVPFVKYFTPTAQHSFTPIISHCPLLNTGEGQTNQERRAHWIKGFCLPFILIYCLSLCYTTVWSHGATTTSSISINRVRKERNMGPVRERQKFVRNVAQQKNYLLTLRTSGDKTAWYKEKGWVELGMSKGKVKTYSEVQCRSMAACYVCAGEAWWGNLRGYTSINPLTKHANGMLKRAKEKREESGRWGME